MKKFIIAAFTAAILAPAGAWAEQSIEEIAAGAELQIQNIPEALNQTSMNDSCAESAVGRVLSTLYNRQFSLQDKLRELNVKIEKTTREVAYLCAAFREWTITSRYQQHSDDMIVGLSQAPARGDGSAFREKLREIRDKDLELRLARQEREAVLRDIAKTEEIIKNMLGKILPQGKSKRLPDEL